MSPMVGPQTEFNAALLDWTGRLGVLDLKIQRIDPASVQDRIVIESPVTLNRLAFVLENVTLSHTLLPDGSTGEFRTGQYRCVTKILDKKKVKENFRIILRHFDNRQVYPDV